MILHQFYLNCLAHASYLIGDEATGTAAVVDPQRDIDQYLAFAEEHRLHIAHVFLTHFHADFLAGHLELRDRSGATHLSGRGGKGGVRLHPAARRRSRRIRTRAAPGARNTGPHAGVDFDRSSTTSIGARPSRTRVLTGDTLFVGDVGRPDLRAALGWSATDLGSMLYDSLRTKLLTLPDASLVYPAHGAGSLCGKAISKETVSTIGEQRRLNYALQPMTKSAVRRPRHRRSTGGAAVFHLRRRAQQPGAADARTGAGRELNPLTLEQVLALQRSGRADSRYARADRFRRRASRRQHQHRTGRPVRHVGWHCAEPRATDRDHRRPGS